MALKKLGVGFDYVQSTAPSSPSAGETWYDQDAADPERRAKIYADQGAGLEWIVIPSANTATEITNAVWSDDQEHGPSDLTATATDKNTATEITNAVWSDDTQHGPSDLKAAAVDWSTKSFDTSDSTTTHKSNTHINIAGSGYLVGLSMNGTDSWAVEIDGGSIWSFYSSGARGLSIFPVRFDSSIKITNQSSGGGSNHAWVVLD